MAIEPINIPSPVSYKGLEDYGEVRDFDLEIVRRLEVNTRALTDALVAQVKVDTSLLPSSAKMATTSNVDDTMKYVSLMA